VAEKHKWDFVKTGFAKVVEPRPKAMAYIVVLSELAVGLGVTLGFLTPIALAGGLLLNILYFVLMIHDWAEQGQNSMMALISVVCIFGQANQAWSIDHLLHILGG
jgi:thiosulfate dehydrogenase [quinone] large subunit